MLQTKIFVSSDFQQNSRLIWDGQDAVCIDPACKDSGIVEYLQQQKLNVRAILLTHSHVDHYGGVKTILDIYPNTPLYGHPIEKDFRKTAKERLAMWGIPEDNYDECPEPTIYVSGGEIVTLIGRDYKVIHTPGHSPGSVSFYCEKENFVLSGDVLFRESVGRTDLPGGSLEALKTSIAILCKLPKSTKVLSGHGPDTSIEHELKSNQFVQAIQ